MHESGTKGTKCQRTVASGRKVSQIRSKVNAKGLQLECTRVLHQAFLVSFLLYGSENGGRREKERSKYRAKQMDNLILEEWIECRTHV